MFEFNEETVGRMTISEALPHLLPIVKAYRLKLSRVNDFRLARFILINLYNNELT